MEIPMDNSNIQDNSWMQAELNANPMPNGERLPAFMFEENKIAEIKIDFSKPWDKWTDPESGTVKKIIPMTVVSATDKEGKNLAGQRMVFFLNVKNPTFREILTAGTKGQSVFKIIRTGKAMATRYQIVKG